VREKKNQITLWKDKRVKVEPVREKQWRVQKRGEPVDGTGRKTRTRGLTVEKLVRGNQEKEGRRGGWRRVMADGRK